MYDYTKRFPGHFKVEKPSGWTYEGISARIDNYGFNIPRLQPNSGQVVTDGPQLKIACLNAMFLINSIYYVRETNLELNLTGHYLGHIESLSGYPAVDLGHKIFPIKTLKLNVEFYLAKTEFRISGSCGTGLTWTFQGDTVPNWQPHFNIFFTVTDRNLSNLFAQEEHVKAFKRNRDSCIPSNLVRS
jgi:hypothetical protein